MLKVVFVLLLAMLSACATLVTGSSQSITVSTNPPAANCTLDRVGARIGAVSSTPGSVLVEKSKNNLSVTCSKDGFQTATVVREPSFNGATLGNLILGGPAGLIIDAASGATFKYPDDIRLDMAANPLPSLPPMAMQPPPSDTDMAPTATATRFDRRPARSRAIKISATGVRPDGDFPH